MSKKYNEENVVFNEKPLSERLENSNISDTASKVKIFDSANAKILTKKQQKVREVVFKIFDKTMLVLNLATNVAFLFFVSDVLQGVKYLDSLYYEFTTFRIIGIIIFAVAQITGLYLFIKMFKNSKLKTRLILATAPISVVLFVGVWALLNIQNINGGAESAIITALGLDNFNPETFELKYVLILVGLYLVGLYLLYGVIFRSSKYAKINDFEKFKND